MMSLDEKRITGIMGQFRNLLREDKNNIQKVRNIPVPAKAIKSLTDRVSITETVYADSADISIQNPWDAPARIISITVIPDSTAKTNGQFKIAVQEVTVMTIDAVADLTEYSSIPVTLPNEGLDIRSREKVELFGKTSSGTSVFNLYVTFQRSE